MSFIPLIFAILLTVPIFWPTADLFISEQFFRVGDKFFLAEAPAFLAAHWLATVGARILLAGLLLALAYTWLRKKTVIGVGAKGWLFLLLALLIGPGLVANVGFKDHWGRARPREIVEFGGTYTFTPAYEAHLDRARSNGSFVAGDAAFGFYLVSFAYLAPRRCSRRAFWGLLGVGGFFGLSRIAMGAHFFSDVVYAAAFMLLASAILYALLFGRAATRDHWRSWLDRKSTRLNSSHNSESRMPSSA
jgi:lipid A 4'-phosphatase